MYISLLPQEAAWVVTNILGGSELHRNAVYLHNTLMDNLINMLLSDQFDIQRQAIFGIQNACL
jgi:hypothetical protein